MPSLLKLTSIIAFFLNISIAKRLVISLRYVAGATGYSSDYQCIVLDLFPFLRHYHVGNLLIKGQNRKCFLLIP
jgi:hypothetical protein